MPSRRRPSARTVTKPGNERPPPRRLERRASQPMSRVASSPATTARTTGSAMSVMSGWLACPADSWETSIPPAMAKRASSAINPARRWAVGRLRPASWDERVSRSTRPTARTATEAVARVTRPAAAQASAGSGSGSPGTSHHWTSTAASARPAATPSGTARSSRANGSTRPSPHRRRSVTPRSDARASSGMRSSLAAVSRRISRASATSTSDRTAGAMELRAVSSWERTSASRAGRSPRASPARDAPSICTGSPAAAAADAAAADRSASVQSGGTTRRWSTRTRHRSSGTASKAAVSTTSGPGM